MNIKGIAQRVLKKLSKPPTQNRFKVVYFGPAGSGKTMSMHCLYAGIDAVSKDDELSELVCEDESGFMSTTFFNVVPSNMLARGAFSFSFSCDIYEPHDPESRQEILAGVSGIIFVADLSAGAQSSNAAALNELEENLSRINMSLKNIPWVIQYNKRDLADAADVQRLDAAINKWKAPIFESVAVESIGALEPFDYLLKTLAQNFEQGD
jgi:GTPase SAR1 family protein